MSALRLRFVRKGLSSSVTYDTSIGNGVDANGFASLPLRPTVARRFYVNSSTGNDANTITQAQNPATPWATPLNAWVNITDGAGDHIAFAQGQSFAQGVYPMGGRGGFSPQYPTVIESYDTTDPFNEAKMGRGVRPVMNTDGTTTLQLLKTIDVGAKYVAVRGLDFNPGNIASANVGGFGGTTTNCAYILIENCILRYTTLGFDMSTYSATRGQYFVVRNCSLYGQWDGSSPTSGQAIYMAYIDGATIEDNVFYHVGWKIGANRTDDISLGGLVVYRHPIYYQEDAINLVCRRNAFLDGYDGGSLRGDGMVHQQNLSFRNSIALAMGKGDNIPVYVPTGAAQDAGYNAMIGSGAVPGGATDRGIWMYNGRTGQSSVHHNVIARSVSQADYSFAPDDNGDPAHITHCDFHDNVAYQWAVSGHSCQTGALLSVTYENNIWDDPASGSNTNIGTHSFPNAYTETSLITALGYADYTSLIADVTSNPEKHVQRHAVNLMLAGYGIDTSAMPYLPNS